MATETRAGRSPGPWNVNGPNHIGAITVISERDGAVVKLLGHHGLIPTAVLMANAEFIVRACNSLDALIEVAKEAAFLMAYAEDAEDTPTGRCYQGLRDAIEKATP